MGMVLGIRMVLAFGRTIRRTRGLTRRGRVLLRIFLRTIMVMILLIIGLLIFGPVLRRILMFRRLRFTSGVLVPRRIRRLIISWMSIFGLLRVVSWRTIFIEIITLGSWVKMVMSLIIGALVLVVWFGNMFFRLTRTIRIRLFLSSLIRIGRILKLGMKRLIRRFGGPIRVLMGLGRMLLARPLRISIPWTVRNMDRTVTVAFITLTGFVLTNPRRRRIGGLL